MTHQPDCIISDDGAILICRCRSTSVHDAKTLIDAVRVRPWRDAKAPAETTSNGKVANSFPIRQTSRYCGAVEQSEHVVFFAPIPGDPEPGQLTVRAVLGVVIAFVVGMLLAATCEGCAPSSAYQPPATYKACSAACERIGCVRHEQEAVCGPLRRFPV